MLKLFTLVLLLSGCEMVDTLDGHIDDQQNCCAAVTKDEIRSCMIDLAPPDSQGWCWYTTCTPAGNVSATQLEDGSIVECLDFSK